MFITMPSTIHQINMIAGIIFLLFLSITPLVHGREILSTIDGRQEENNNNEVTGLFSRTISEDAEYSTISGGGFNAASAYASTVGGGYDNIATGLYSTVGGGRSNKATNEYSTISGGAFNTASGTDSTVGGGNDNTASRDGSSIAGGYSNMANGVSAFVGGGSGNTANGDYSIAMGRKAKAETDQSCVINLLPEKEASSTKVGEFLVSSKAFTIRIGSKKVTINKNNIKNFKNLLKGPGHRLKQIDVQKEIIKELQQQNNKQQEQNDAQQSTIEELHEKMEELHHMMTGFIAQQQQQQQLDKANNY